MAELDENDELVLRPALAVRGLAFALIGFGIALPFLTDPGGIPFGIGFVILGVVGLRIGVRVGRDGVAINNGLRTTNVPWTEVEGFRVLNGSNGGVCVLVAGGEVKRLPWEELTLVGKQAARSELAQRLEELRAVHQR